MLISRVYIRGICPLYLLLSSTIIPPSLPQFLLIAFRDRRRTSATLAPRNVEVLRSSSCGMAFNTATASILLLLLAYMYRCSTLFKLSMPKHNILLLVPVGKHSYLLGFLLFLLKASVRVTCTANHLPMLNIDVFFSKRSSQTQFAHKSCNVAKIEFFSLLPHFDLF